MEKSHLIILGNNNLAKEEMCKKIRLCLAMDTISELFDIESGSLTIRFHEGRWCSNVEIQKNILAEINET